MIPILYEKDELTFTSNGLGRLRDCAFCIVTEERNGEYTCDFDYPVDGAHFDEITLGRIIAVEHDDSDDIQPFDIVSYSKPINGIVSFHAVHISYRLRFTTTATQNARSLNAVLFACMGRFCEPTHPFTFWTDKQSEGYFPLGDGLPHSVREMLGGAEGSILDTYGGEYEFDKLTVKLWENRGQYRDFSIRYGQNMTDYIEETDISDSYMAISAYWTDGTDRVRGAMQVSPIPTITDRGECIPLDISDRFESKPTQSEVEAMALSILNENKPMLPTQNIHVEFVRLQDLGYEQYANLLQCKLCDTINVIFPRYGIEKRFKIVKTEYNVLRDRYESMELGDLSTTLSEALGISNGGSEAKTTKTSGTLSASDFTITTGAFYSGSWVKDGNVVMLFVNVRNAASVASGSNVFVGTLNKPELVPALATRCGGFFGGRTVNSALNTAGVLTARNCAETAIPAMSESQYTSVTFTYLV